VEFCATKIYDHCADLRERAVRHDPTPMSDGESWKNPRCGCTTWRRETQLPSRRIELDEFRANLELALGKLPPRLRQVFQLTKLRSVRIGEVCAKMNISRASLGDAAPCRSNSRPTWRWWLVSRLKSSGRPSQFLAHTESLSYVENFQVGSANHSVTLKLEGRVVGPWWASASDL